jgi:hypothetical protein
MSDQPAIDRLLSAGPFELDAGRKRDLFAAALGEAFRHHLAACATFRRYCASLGFSPSGLTGDLERYPYLPATFFKQQDLSSVSREDVVAIVRSSATAGPPSTIHIDRTTARRQATASAKVIAAYLGQDRRRFLVLDEDPAGAPSPAMPARSAATRGFLVCASDAEYFLAAEGGRPVVDLERLVRRLLACEASAEPVCLFGFTYIVYQDVVAELMARGFRCRLPAGSSVAHIGGWKRLADRRVGRERFLEDVWTTLGVLPGQVFDFYGFTEQMGLVYGSPGLAPKTVPAYAEVIIRNPDTLLPAVDGSPGLIQVLTPLPHSYPGVSVLTEDVGRIVGRGCDASGRHGTRFEVLGRAVDAEPRGCGDLPRDARVER